MFQGKLQRDDDFVLVAFAKEHDLKISTIEKLTDLTDNILTAVEALEEALAALKDCEDIFATSEAIRDSILPSMNTLRGYVDAAEMLTSAKYWPYPSYGKLLFSVQ